MNVRGEYRVRCIYLPQLQAGCRSSCKTPVEEIEASSTTLTARGALLRLHALFAPVAAVSLAVRSS